MPFHSAPSESRPREATVPSARGLCSHVPALPLTSRGGLRVWRACAPLRCLSLGTRPSTCASDAQARRVVLATLAPCTKEGHCTSDKPPILRRHAVLPRASPAPHIARWLTRIARLRATALALSGTRPSTRACRARARRAALAAIDSCTMEGHRTSEKAPFFGARPCSHEPALLLTARGGLCL